MNIDIRNVIKPSYSIGSKVFITGDGVLKAGEVVNWKFEMTARQTDWSYLVRCNDGSQWYSSKYVIGGEDAINWVKANETLY